MCEPCGTGGTPGCAPPTPSSSTRSWRSARRSPGSVYRGEEGVQRWAAEIDDQFEHWEVIVAGTAQVRPGLLIVQGEIRATGRGSGVDIDQPASGSCTCATAGSRESTTSSGWTPPRRRPGKPGPDERASPCSTASCASARSPARPGTSARRPTRCWRSCASWESMRSRTTRRRRLRAGAGNLIARIPGSRRGLGRFLRPRRHGPPRGPIEVVLADGVFRSAGETILGADNKAAVAVLLELAARRRPPRPRSGSSWSSPSPRRTGCAARRSSTPRRCSSPYRLRPRPREPDRGDDHRRADLQTPARRVRGPRRTSGLRPEDGRSAIVAASAAVGAMKLGRLDEETTANVG